MADPVTGEPLADRPYDADDESNVVRGRVVNLNDDMAIIDFHGSPQIKVGDEVEIVLGSVGGANLSPRSQAEVSRAAPAGGGYGCYIRIRLKGFDHRILGVDARNAGAEVRTPPSPLATKDSSEIEQVMARFSQIERQFDQLERDHFVTIDLDTGEFCVAPSRLTSVQSFESKFGAGKSRITMHIGSNLS